MSRRSWLSALGLLFLTGCFTWPVSLHPLYTERDLVFEPTLLGEWSQGDEGTWTFTRAGEDGYRLHLRASASILEGPMGTAEFEAHLVEIRGHLFLDLLPVRQDTGAPLLHQLQFVPGHCFLWVRQIEPTLKMAMIDVEWLEEHLEEKPRAIRHEVTDDVILLTEPPKKLQRFFLRLTEIEEAWGEFSCMTRTSETRVEPANPPLGNGTRR